jgi:hypothetical protein
MSLAMQQYEIQSMRLWNHWFGRNPLVKAKDFKAYLASIPLIPASLLGDDPKLPFLSLADPRLGLLKSCRLLGIRHEDLGYSEGDGVLFDERFALPASPFWFRHDDGRKNRKRRSDHCRDEATGDILVGTAMEGIFAFAHHPHIVVEGEHVIHLPGTVRHSGRASCAYLGVWDGQAELYLDGLSVLAHPGYGALRVRRK